MRLGWQDGFPVVATLAFFGSLVHIEWQRYSTSPMLLSPLRLYRATQSVSCSWTSLGLTAKNRVQRLR